ncbi:Putative glutathione-dependent formaldehyde-activating enzyme [Frankliniella fusca]|uniref:Glutathione-dependent formaldehyde-activating enzyme n=1 Tax=Frankliniella fusca TaxID=407009 RepID=A0AAE1LAL8_9NEOP|nr:Putative glutathione-dependent formaldehyde-activating enzyme [Frankliniella fusca]
MADDNRRQPQLPNVRPPDEFPFSPSEWSNWRARWAQYHMLSNLKNQAAEYQANSLLYSMGPRAIQVVETFNLTAAQKKDHDALLDAFDRLYKATKNTVYDRAKFFRRAQQQGHPEKEASAKTTAEQEDLDMQKLRKVNELEEPEDYGEDEGSAAINSVTKARFGPSPYLGEVKRSIREAGVEYVEYQPLLLDIQVGKLGELEFKADSGADAPVMGKEYLSLLGPVKLQKCGPLRAAGDLTLEVHCKNTRSVHGKFKTTLQWQDKHHEVRVYVLERQQKPLLGRPTMIKFGLIDLSVYKPVKVLATQHPRKQAAALPEMEHPEIFKGLGVMPGDKDEDDYTEGDQLGTGIGEVSIENDDVGCSSSLSNIK